jgi:hypothetical protein
MSDKIEFVLELTREEALGLMLLYGKMMGYGFRASTVDRIAKALDDADPSLFKRQFEIDRINNVSTIDLSDCVSLPRSWA